MFHDNEITKDNGISKTFSVYYSFKCMVVKGKVYHSSKVDIFKFEKLKLFIQTHYFV